MNDNLQQGCHPGVFSCGSLPPPPAQGRSAVQVECVPKCPQGCGDTAVCHVNCRVTCVYDFWLMSWLFYSLLQDLGLGLCGGKGVMLGKVRPEPWHPLSSCTSYFLCRPSGSLILASCSPLVGFERNRIDFHRSAFPLAHCNPWVWGEVGDGVFSSLVFKAEMTSSF